MDLLAYLGSFLGGTWHMWHVCQNKEYKEQNSLWRTVLRSNNITHCSTICNNRGESHSFTHFFLSNCSNSCLKVGTSWIAITITYRLTPRLKKRKSTGPGCSYPEACQDPHHLGRPWAFNIHPSGSASSGQLGQQTVGVLLEGTLLGSLGHNDHNGDSYLHHECLNNELAIIWGFCKSSFKIMQRC